MKLSRPINLTEIPSDLYDDMTSHNMVPPFQFFLDGTIHRFGKNDDCWYMGFDDNNPVAVYGDWSKGETYKWAGFSSMSETEAAIYRTRIEEAQKAREALREKEAIEAKSKAQKIYLEAKDASLDNPYVQKKHIKPLLAKEENGKLILPMFCDNEIVSLQFISADSSKRYLAGGKTKGAFLPLQGDSSVVYVAEGWATGISVYEATGHTVFVAFSANNLKNVTAMLQEKGIAPIVVADNDESKTGEKSAIETNCRYIMIPIVGMDANDYANSGYDLKELLEPKTWLTKADEFASNPAPIHWLIKHWLPKESLIMVHGSSGCGKTFLTLDWLLSISTGMGYWFEHKITKGSVMYLCGEGQYGLKSRLVAWKQTKAIKSFENFYVSQSAVDMDTLGGINVVVGEIDKTGIIPDIIAIDTLNRFFQGDENSAQESRLFINNCTKLIDKYKCSILIIHHTGVSQDAQKRARGSSAWKGALDVEISVEKDDKGLMSIECMKSKDTQEPDKVFLALQGVTIDGWYDEDGEAVTSAVIVEGEQSGDETKDADLKQLEEAFKVVGQFNSKGEPFLQKNDWVDYKVQTTKSTRNNLKSFFHNEYQPVKRLIKASVLSESEGIYYVVDRETKDLFTLLYKGKNNDP